MRRALPLLGVLTLLAVAILYLVWREEFPPPLAWQGYAEADYVNVAPVQTGRIVTLAVARGAWVKPGAALFDQDDTDQRAALAGAVAALAQAEAQLANLIAPSRPDEIDAAIAALAQAQASRDRIAGDLARDAKVVGSGAVTRQKVDQERADLAAAEASVAAARARLALTRRPTGRAQAIAAARATVAAARAARDQAAWSLAQRHVAAPVAAVVSDLDARAGETVNAGATVVQLLPPANIRARFFVPETGLGAIRLGQTVAIACDACGGAIAARISFIAPQPEYTPPVIFSEQSKSRLVFMVEATPAPDQAMRLKPGEPVEVRPAASR
ncbi:MAG: HlyD family efflux transporter periplasmic adaptor subunit [Rhodospirillales bacterium]|nr:HlyD family efflux transporter periplasmic adaptor subunit [Rhodospirillales bacterium]